MKFCEEALDLEERAVSLERREAEKLLVTELGSLHSKILAAECESAWEEQIMSVCLYIECASSKLPNSPGHTI